MRRGAPLLALALVLLATPASANKLLWDTMVNQCAGLARFCTRPTPVPTAVQTPRGSVTPTPFGAPTPSPGPSSEPTPEPTPVPIPSLPEVDDSCADGYLDKVLQSDSLGKLYGVSNVRITAGARKQYCARLAPPILPADDFSPGSIVFEWVDLSGLGCGALYVSVAPVGDPLRVRSTSGFVSDGNLQFTRSNGVHDDPALTAPGVYAITVSGGAETCVLYRIGWRWLP